MSTVSVRPSGRPSRKSAKAIDSEIKFYWEGAIGIMECVLKTGYSSRTVSKRYDKWDKLLKDRQDVKFLEQQDKAKARALLALDKQILVMLELQSKAESEKTEVKARLAWMIFEMTDKKTALELAPTVASKVKQEVNELIEKYQKLPLTERELQDSK